MAVISVIFAVLVTLYFFWQNIMGIHESSDKALKIMIATTVMAVIMLIWCGVTLIVQDRPSTRMAAAIPCAVMPEFSEKVNYSAAEPDKAERSIRSASSATRGWATRLRGLGKTASWLSIAWRHRPAHRLRAFDPGHERRGDAGPGLSRGRVAEAANFKKAAFVVFVYSLLFTGGISFLAVLLIPNDDRMPMYTDNLIGGLAMNVLEPAWTNGWARCSCRPLSSSSAF